jgi:Domain of unknown function (DUF4136)
MKQPLRLLLTLLFVLSVRSSSAQKVKTDYVKDYNFASLKRFAWRKNHLFTMRHPEDNELLDLKIMRAVSNELAAKGIVEDAANPDFYVFYHGGPGDEGIRTGASPPATWDSIQPPALTPGTGSGMWNAHGNLNAGFAPNVWYSMQGHVVFYAEDVKSKIVVWEGAATKTWHDPQKARKNEDKEIKQIAGKSFKDFPPKSRK